MKEFLRNNMAALRGQEHLKPLEGKDPKTKAVEPEDFVVKGVDESGFIDDLHKRRKP